MLCHVLRDATPMFQMLRTNQAISASSCGESPIEHASRKRAATQATGTTPRTHQCPGMTTIEMQACAAEQRNQSLKALKQNCRHPIWRNGKRSPRRFANKLSHHIKMVRSTPSLSLAAQINSIDPHSINSRHWEINSEHPPDEEEGDRLPSPQPSFRFCTIKTYADTTMLPAASSNKKPE